MNGIEIKIGDTVQKHSLIKDETSHFKTAKVNDIAPMYNGGDYFVWAGNGGAHHPQACKVVYGVSLTNHVEDIIEEIHLKFGFDCKKNSNLVGIIPNNLVKNGETRISLLLIFLSLLQDEFPDIEIKEYAGMLENVRIYFDKEETISAINFINTEPDKNVVSMIFRQAINLYLYENMLEIVKKTYESKCNYLTILDVNEFIKKIK